MNTQGLIYNFVATLLRLALILALVGAVWNIHRNLPEYSSNDARSNENAVAETSLKIVLRDPSGELRVPKNLPLALYPIDITAVQNEFRSEYRPGVRPDEFLAERMGNRAPVDSHFDDNGEVTLTVRSGPWWIHATLPGEVKIEWRLHVNVSGQKQTVELNLENAYTRTRSF
jgi:hypothetical protein